MTQTYRQNIGRTVLCDMCNEDYTDSPESGGFIFGSYAVCPKCAPRIEKDITRYREQHAIHRRTADGESFADMVRDYRGPDGGFIEITTIN